MSIGLELDGRGSVPSSGKIILFSVATRPVVRTTQFPMQWVAEAISSGYNSWNVKLTTHHCLVPTSRIVQLCRLPHIHIHGVVLDQVSTGATLHFSPAFANEVCSKIVNRFAVAQKWI